MHPALTGIDPLLEILGKVLSTRGWCKPTTSLLLSMQEKLASERCVFRILLSLDRSLSGSSRALLEQLTQSGVSLLLGWPRVHQEVINEWLGPRFYFSASANFSSGERFVSLVSSQLGRHGSKVPNWPALVDAALHNARRDHERPLILPGTSLSEATEQFSKRAGLVSLKIQLDNKTTIENWLSNLLNELELTCAVGNVEALKKECWALLRISPAEKQAIAPELVSLPLQDRVAFALADRVMAIYVRRQGTIAKLAGYRLADDRYPTGSVYIASTFGEQATHQPDFEQWLERGAVGWLLHESPKQPDRVLADCRKQVLLPYIQSLCVRIPTNWSARPWCEGAWPFLTHCTRGNSGPLPNETVEHFRDRAWSAGAIPTCHPLSTLQQILNDARIKGNTRLTRSEEACVSFSEVPLAELLSRRQFRSHLGRWDWEPYGILIRRDALEQLGARRVVYGDEVDFQQLADEDKPYFQPSGTKNSRNYQDWTSEREWRILRDLNLAELPYDSLLIFVATKTEAQQVARRCRWPVVWKGDR